MKKELVDKGFELCYYNLSYRRRFIRTLWLIPWEILLLCFMHWRKVPLFIIAALAIFFTVATFIQALHNYKKWKEDAN